MKETGGFIQDMHIHNALTIPQENKRGREGLYNVFRCVDGRGQWDIGIYKWDKLKGLHELYPSWQMDEAWKRCSTINEAINSQWNEKMMSFREDLKNLSSLGMSKLDHSCCWDNRTDRSKYVQLYDYYIEDIYKWFLRVMGENTADHSIAPVQLMRWIGDEEIPMPVPVPKTPPKAGAGCQDQSQGIPLPKPRPKRKTPPEATAPAGKLVKGAVPSQCAASTVPEPLNIPSQPRPPVGKLANLGPGKGAVPSQGAASTVPKPLNIPSQPRPPPTPPPCAPCHSHPWRNNGKPPSAVNIPSQQVKEAEDKVELARRCLAEALQSRALNRCDNVVRRHISSKDTHNGISHYIILLLLKSVWHGITDFICKHKPHEFPALTFKKWKRKGGRLVKNWHYMRQELGKTELALDSNPICWTEWLSTDDVAKIISYNLELIIPPGNQVGPDGWKLKFF